VNAVAAEPMKEFQPNLTQISSTVEPKTDYFSVTGSKVKVTKDNFQNLQA